MTRLVAVTEQAGPPERKSPALLLEIERLSIEVAGRHGPLRIVDGLDLRIGRGERMALVGESGSGKTMTARAIMRLNQRVRTTGQIRFDNQDLLSLTEKEMSAYRGSRIGMVFQDPLRALNPVKTIGSQVIEPLRVRGMKRRLAEARAIELLDAVGVPSAASRMRSYPYEFSGGMRQRVVVAMALIGEPELLIADEPTTALDGRMQRKVIDLLDEVCRARDLAVLLITHDMGLVAQFADRASVMHAGRKVEENDVVSLFADPAHPYTRGLLDAVPRIDREPRYLTTLPGTPVTPATRPAGCAFHTRCPLALEVCSADSPALLPMRSGVVACHLTAPATEMSSGAGDVRPS